jgi:abequosyltransferase
MGDDDIFDTENLPQFIKFIKEHNNLGYILKTHAFIHSDGSVELFKYYPNDTFFEPGVFSYQSLFRKSVFISGFCINRKYALPFQTEIFDGTLLYQLYLLAEVTLLHPSAYCSIPLTIQNENLRCAPLFGSSESEQKLYTPGKITVENSLNFMSGYINITNYIDRKHNIESTKFIKNNFSKYSYPVISIQRDKGRIVFMDYCKKLEELMHINQTFYYYIYYYSLLIFGRRICDKAIIIIKKLLGRTPNL